MRGSASDIVLDLYQEHAAAWARLRAETVGETPWLDAFLETMPRAGRDVLDIGCGTGRPIAAHLIERGCRITGLDGAPALIEIARGSFPDQTWIAADMRDLPPLGRFRGLVAWHSLFHLRPEDQRPMFGAFGRLGLPGATLLFTSGTEHGDAIGSFEGRPLYHGSLDTTEYRHLLERNGFEVVRYVEGDPACGAANVWLARKS